MGLVCAPEQQRGVAGRLPDASPTFRIHTAVGGERARNGILARCFRELGLGGPCSQMLVQSGWIYASFPDPPGNGLSGDGGDSVPELLHRESVYEVYLSN